ncbi:MAG: hypothetical protein KF752_19620 [Pirellulaceae bacterium]|nr:hypothetical protein [Pirellulaceae bacterium]
MPTIELERIAQQSHRTELSRDWQRFRAVQRLAALKLQGSRYYFVRQVTCEVQGQVLILKGQVPSFYMKQIAQTLVRDLLRDGLVLDNRVEVDSR